MAHHKRKKARIHARSNIHRLASWPAWWDILHHRRPKRRCNRRMERAVLMGWLDADEAAWPLGNHKPHNYYW